MRPLSIRATVGCVPPGEISEPSLTQPGPQAALPQDLPGIHDHEYTSGASI